MRLAITRSWIRLSMVLMVWWSEWEGTIRTRQETTTRSLLQAVDRREQLFQRHRLRNQMLVGEIGNQRFEGRAVLLDPIGPGIAAEKLEYLIDVAGQPRHHVAQSPQVIHALERDLLGALERVEEAGRNEWILLVDLLLDHDEVHDRADPRALVIFLFELDEVGKQPPDIRVGPVRLRQAGADSGVDLPFLNQVVERLAAVDELHLDRLEQRQHGRGAMRPFLIDGALHPGDVREIDAVFVLQQPADEDRRCHRVERDPDAFSFEVLWLLDAGFLVDGDEAVAKAARGKDRDGDEGAVFVGVALDVFRA